MRPPSTHSTHTDLSPTPPRPLPDFPFIPCRILQRQNSVDSDRIRHTKAVDVFSLGCLIYYCLTGGGHPFGEGVERDTNILRGNSDLWLLKRNVEACNLIGAMIQRDPKKRPTVAAVLAHPMWWNSDTRLSFLTDLSNRMEHEDRATDPTVLDAFESFGGDALNGKPWDRQVHPLILSEGKAFRKYNHTSVRDLVRIIRNKFNHYRELSAELKGVIGSVPDGMDAYFATAFPRLVQTTFSFVVKHCGTVSYERDRNSAQHAHVRACVRACACGRWMDGWMDRSSERACVRNQWQRTHFRRIADELTPFLRFPFLSFALLLSFPLPLLYL